MTPAQVKEALAAPAGWTDTPEQAQIRACLTAALADRDPVDALAVASAMITVLRDQILPGVARVRRDSAHAAKAELGSVKELVLQSGQTRQTLTRLLAEYRAEGD
jgi:hypothetical protein